MKTARNWEFYYETVSGLRVPAGTFSFISPERSGVWKMLQRIHRDDNSIARIGYGVVKSEQEKTALEKEWDLVNDVCDDARYKIKDKGTCCTGMALRYNGRKVMAGFWQGNTSNYALFELVQNALIERMEYKKELFSIDHGTMD